MPANTPLARVSLAALLVIATGAIAQGNFGFLTKMPAGNFSKEDLAMLKQALATVLNTADTTTRSWNNPKTGSGGTIRTLRVYRGPDGEECKELQLDNHARGYQGSSKQSLCRHENNWRDTSGGISIPAQ